MRKLILLFIPLLATLSAMSQQNSTQGKIAYSGTRLTYPLVQGWVKEFNKTYPSIDITLIPRGDTLAKADLKILAYNLSHETFDPKETYTVVARYAQLPITNTLNPALAKWKTQGIKKEELKNLYFNTGNDAAGKPSHVVTIYTRERPACATKAFASHFNSHVKESKGVGVKGDDQSLLEAVKKDTHGVSYNNLGFVFNIHTRKVVEDIAIIPIDLNDNNKVDPSENFYATLDDVIEEVEASKKNEIPVDHVNFVYQKDFQNPAVKLFLDWVLSSKGQALTHQYGFLKNQEEHKVYSSNK